MRRMKYPYLFLFYLLFLNSNLHLSVSFQLRICFGNLHSSIHSYCLFNKNIDFLPSISFSLIAASTVPSSVIFTPKLLYSLQYRICAPSSKTWSCCYLPTHMSGFLYLHIVHIVVVLGSYYLIIFKAEDV